MKIPLAKANSSFSCYQQVGVPGLAQGATGPGACVTSAAGAARANPGPPHCAALSLAEPNTSYLLPVQECSSSLQACMGERTGSAADLGPPAALISDRPPSAAATVYGGLPNVPVTLSHHLCMLFAA